MRMFVQPTVALAVGHGRGRQAPIDASSAGRRRNCRRQRFDLFTLDGLLNALGRPSDMRPERAARGAERVNLRSYVLCRLALTAVVVLLCRPSPGRAISLEQ